MQLVLWHIKNLQLPLGKSQPLRFLWGGTNQLDISPSTRNPCLAKRIDKWNQIKNKQEEESGNLMV